MTNIDEEFFKRKKEILRKHREVSGHMVDMVNDMATADAIEFVHAMFDFLRYTDPLGGPDHKLHTKYVKDVVNVIYAYQNRYLSTFLIVAGHEIRDLEKAAERAQLHDYSILQQFGKNGLKVLQELLKRREQEEEERKKNSKESIDPPSEKGAGDKV
jgi:hypothetical protein